jgi:glyoxylase-like metal-dependent hydrolase (beta-lactamase superfamily II)
MFIVPGIIQVRVPLPFQLNIVNCYLVQGAGSWALIDTGINWPPARAAWRQALEQAGLRFQDISAIYVTHYHPDHLGLAGWWQERSGAPVYMTPREAQTAHAVWQHPDAADAASYALFRQHGVPDDVAAQALEGTRPTYGMVQPLPDIGVLDIETGSTLRIADRAMRALVLPGHADAQLCLYDVVTHTFFAVDHVLAAITPNISVLPGTCPDPLGRYLASFATLEALDVATVLPGHGTSFTDLLKRLAELRVHHDQRLNVITAAIGDGATAYKVSTRVFAAQKLSPYQLQFALGETLAHLEYLVVQDRVERVGEDLVRYQIR